MSAQHVCYLILPVLSIWLVYSLVGGMRVPLLLVGLDIPIVSVKRRRRSCIKQYLFQAIMREQLDLCKMYCTYVRSMSHYISYPIFFSCLKGLPFFIKSFLSFFFCCFLLFKRWHFLANNTWIWALGWILEFTVLFRLFYFPLFLTGWMSREASCLRSSDDESFLSSQPFI